MTIIHAYRRTTPCSVDLFGSIFKFVANDQGEFVCDVPAGPAQDRLLELSEGYRLHGAQTKAAEDDDTPPPVSPYVLTVEGEGGAESTVDLRELSLEQLHEFCKANEIPFHPNSKEPKLRDVIVAFFKVE